MNMLVEFAQELFTNGYHDMIVGRVVWNFPGAGVWRDRSTRRIYVRPNWHLCCMWKLVQYRESDFTPRINHWQTLQVASGSNK